LLASLVPGLLKKTTALDITEVLKATLLLSAKMTEETHLTTLTLWVSLVMTILIIGSIIQLLKCLPFLGRVEIVLIGTVITIADAVEVTDFSIAHCLNG
jgi:hypothetical protein